MPTETKTIPLDQIVPSPFQTRTVFDDAKLQELASTMREHGLLNPILVRPVGDAFELIAGERRFRAAKLLGWTSIEARVETVDDREAAEQVVVENLQREDLNPIEQAEGYKKLADMGLDQAEIARKVGEDQPTIARYLAFLELPDKLKEFMSQDIISATQVRYLGRIKDEIMLVQTAQTAGSEGWSVKETERKVNAILESDGKARKSKKRGTKPQQDLVWRGAEIVINRHFRPAEETKAEFLDWLSGALDTLLVAMPGLKDGPKTGEEQLKVMRRAAKKASDEMQKTVDEIVAHMTPEQQRDLAEQFKAGQAMADRANQAAHEKLEKQIAAEESANQLFEKQNNLQ